MPTHMCAAVQLRDSRVLASPHSLRSCVKSRSSRAVSVQTRCEDSDRRVAKWTTEVTRKVKVSQEGQRPLSEFIQHQDAVKTLLQADKVEEVREGVFKCFSAPIKFLTYQLVPATIVEVECKGDGTGCVVEGIDSEMYTVEDGVLTPTASGDSFRSLCLNDISFEVVEDSEIEVTSDVCITTEVVLPGWFPVSAKMVSKFGKASSQGIIEKLIDKLVADFASSYASWSEN